MLPFRCAGFCGLECTGVDVAVNLASLPSWQDGSQLSVTHSSRAAVSEFKLMEFAVQFPSNCLVEMKFPVNSEEQERFPEIAAFNACWV